MPAPDFVRTGVFVTQAEAQRVHDAWRPGVFTGGILGGTTGADESKRMIQILALKYSLPSLGEQTYGLDTEKREFLAPPGWTLPDSPIIPPGGNNG